ncbi:MAG: ABC transporter ATP-binding protein, partial [Sporichthyaceae bacterium]|nr:ABC transporter ATP-binding protein [Sporichthyaceae bacterium]
AAPGVVTSLVLRTRPAVAATVFEYRWPHRYAAEIINAWLRWAPAAPDEINAELALVATEDPAEDPFVAVFGISVGLGTGFIDIFGRRPEQVLARSLDGAAAALHHTYPGDAPGDLAVTGPSPDAQPGLLSGLRPGLRPGLRLARSEFFDDVLPLATVAELVDHLVRDRLRGQSRDLGRHWRAPRSAAAPWSTVNLHNPEGNAWSTVHLPATDLARTVTPTCLAVMSGTEVWPVTSFADPGGVAAVSLRGLRKSFGAVEAVAGIDLEVADGEFFSMLGPSGSGKTTVLRLIAGFELPTAGTVTLSGRDVTRLAPFERDVNTVFQDYALFPHMSVQENIEYGLRVRRVAKPERRERAEQALRTVRLAGFGDRRPSALSGG